MGSEIAPKQLSMCQVPVHCQVATKSLGSFVHLIAYGSVHIAKCFRDHDFGSLSIIVTGHSWLDVSHGYHFHLHQYNSLIGLTKDN